MAVIGEDEGILGNDLAIAYLHDLSAMRKEHMGECLPCTIRSVTEVRAITEETLAVRAMGPATLAPHTVTQVRVIVPTPGARGTCDGRNRAWTAGVCPVPGVVEVVSQYRNATDPYRAERGGSHGRVRYGRTRSKSGKRPERQGRGERISGASGPTPHRRGVPAVAGSHGCPQAPICNRKKRSWTDRHLTAPDTHGRPTRD